MEANAKAIIFADVQRVLKVIIVKLGDARHNDRRVLEHVGMGPVNQTIHVFVILVGLESYVIKTNHGLRNWQNILLFFIN